MFNFLDNDSSYTPTAHFSTANHELVIIDCPITTAQTIKKHDFPFKKLIVFVTHLHSGSCSGLGLLVQHFHFILKKEITIVAPSQNLNTDIVYLLENIECCSSSWYNIITSDEFTSHWFWGTVPSSDSIQPHCKCFGYIFLFGTQVTYYLGDIFSFESLPTNSNFFLDTSIYSFEIENIIELLENFDTRNSIYITVPPEKKNQAKKLVENICNVYII